jgi:hypothetical protein
MIQPGSFLISPGAPERLEVLVDGALGGPVHLLAVVSAFLEQPTEVAARGAGLLAGHQPVIAETRRRD